MSEIDYILSRVAEGDKLKFFQDYYGAQWVELTSGWLIKRKSRIDLGAEDIAALKTALRNQRRQAAAAVVESRTKADQRVA